MSVVGPFEKAGLQKTFEGVRWTSSCLEVSG